MHSLYCFLALVAPVVAHFPRNLNYGSPSLHHPGLGVSVHRVNKRNDPAQAYTPAQLNFTHGVASGDPYPDSVILWTRVAPMLDSDRSNVTVEGYVTLYGHETEPYVNASKAPVCVEYAVGEDEDLEHTADSGTVKAPSLQPSSHSPGSSELIATIEAVHFPIAHTMKSSNVFVPLGPRPAPNPCPRPPVSWPWPGQTSRGYDSFCCGPSSQRTDGAIAAPALHSHLRGVPRQLIRFNGDSVQSRLLARTCTDPVAMDTLDEKSKELHTPP